MKHVRALQVAAGAGTLVLAGALGLGTASLAGAASTTAGSSESTATAGSASATSATGLGAGTFTSATSVAGAGSAGASSTTPAASPNTPITRSKLEADLSNRQQVLAALTTSVQSSGLVSGTVQATLLSQLTAETNGINGLAALASTEPTTQLAGTQYTMIHQYRVYLVMAPKVHIAERRDSQQAAESKWTGREPAIEARIEKVQSKGKTVQDAQTAYEALVATLGQATSDTQGVDVTAVLGVTPTGYPGDGGPIASARSGLDAARGLRPKIRSDILTIRADLLAVR